jgi:hypothetical protein
VAEARGNLRFLHQVALGFAPSSITWLRRHFYDAGWTYHVLRDPTRGGLATTLVDRSPARARSTYNGKRKTYP